MDHGQEVPRSLVRQVRLGVALQDALDSWAAESVDPLLGLVADALAIAQRTGGSQERALDAVVAAARDREALRREVRALASQARASAAVMVLMPMAFALIVAVLDPRVARFYVGTALGPLAVGVGLALDGLGALVDVAARAAGLVIRLVAAVAAVGIVIAVAVPHRPLAPSVPAVGVRTVTRGSWPGRLGPPRSVERVVAGLTVLTAWVVFGPVALVLGTGVGLVVPSLLRRDADRRRRRAIGAALPELIDLFTIAASAGHPVPSALASVGPRAPGPVRQLVGEAVVRFERGIPLAESLDLLAVDLGPGSRDLVHALNQATASGAPLAPLLDAVARTSRDTRRRESQAAARRLPVTMLLPLAMCVLPAAIVLAVVPVLMVSIASLAP